MKVTWPHAKQINVGVGRQLVELSAGQPFEMDDGEALARIAQGGDCEPFDADEHAALLAKAQEPPGEPVDAGSTEDSPGAPEAVSVAPRGRKRASDASAPAPTETEA